MPTYKVMNVVSKRDLNLKLITFSAVMAEYSVPIHRNTVAKFDGNMIYFYKAAVGLEGV